MRTHACGARLSPLIFIVKQVAPAELSAFFSFGSARKQIAPPARMRRFAPSCSRTSLRSSYLLPIVPWCACCSARLCPLLFTVKQVAPVFHLRRSLLSFLLAARARLLRVCVASLPHAVGLRCARPTLVRAAGVNAKIFARPRVNARARACAHLTPLET